jgi:hypothetical protein
MKTEFALHLSDVRLLQTLRLLESSLHDHPDQEAVKEALLALGRTRDTVANLIAVPETRGKCCA